jgi:hypothetical protein
MQLTCASGTYLVRRKGCWEGPYSTRDSQQSPAPAEQQAAGNGAYDSTNAFSACNFIFLSLAESGMDSQ